MDLKQLDSQVSDIKIEMMGFRMNNPYKIWCNLVTFEFTKSVQHYRLKVTCVDEEKGDFAIRVEKEQNLRQKVLNKFEIQNKLQEMFLGRYIYNDTLIMVIEPQPDKKQSILFEDEVDGKKDNYNLELSIELQGEKTDQRSILRQCREILTVFQKNVIKQLRYGKQHFQDPNTQERVQGADHINVVKGMSLNMDIYKPNTMKLNIDYKVACVFNQDVTMNLRMQFQSHNEVTYDQLILTLKERKFTDQDTKLYMDELIPKQEVYTPTEVMNLSAMFQRTLRNMRFKRDPVVVRLCNVYFCCDNKDIHGNDQVKKAVKFKQLKDQQFQQFCNETLQKLRTHWLFKENGIVFQSNYNIIPIERSLGATIQLGSKHNNETQISTHNQSEVYDNKYNDTQKNVSNQIQDLGNPNLSNWLIIYESTHGLREKIDEMLNKIKRSLEGLQSVNIAYPNIVEIQDISRNFDWNSIKGNQLVVFALNSRARKDQLTRKQETIKYKCQSLRDTDLNPEGIPNQVILTKTFEQHDFLKMVSLNLMYDFILKLPNNVGHKLCLGHDNVGQWVGDNTMVFAVDQENRKGCKNVCAILHQVKADFTYFKSDYFSKSEDSDLRYNEDSKVKFKDIVKDAIKNWYKVNTEINKKMGKDQAVLKRIIVQRDGVTGIQKRFLENSEIAMFNEVITEIMEEDKKNEIELFFLTADKRISTKIFEYNERENKLSHLEAGIFIDKNIIKDARPSFYLNASNNRMSKCCQQEVMYPKQIPNTNIFNYIMSFTFKLSFLQQHGYNIANIATPSILKYAQKKAQFQSIYEGLKDDNDKIRDEAEILKRKRD